VVTPLSPLKLEDVSSNGYGGVMIRETNAPGARQASLFSNLTNILRHESRALPMHPKTVNAFYKINPVWLRLDRQGDWIFAYSSADGYNFQYVHAVFVPMGYCVDVGVASFTFSPVMTADAVFSNISVTGAYGGVSEEDPTLPAEVEVAPLSLETKLFPNPTQDRFTIQLDQPLETNSQLVLRSGLGQVVGTRTLDCWQSCIGLGYCRSACRTVLSRNSQ
jgi:hypothetical protein